MRNDPDHAADAAGAPPGRAASPRRRDRQAGAVRRVALLVETSNSYARGLIRGVIEYARTHGRWSVYLGEHSRGDEPPGWLRHWDGDGIIARVENVRIAAAVARSGRPAVDMSAARLLPRLPWVETDDAAIAHAAADHLMARGLAHFAYCGDDRFNWSKWRCEHFGSVLRGRGRPCAVYRPRARAARDWTADEDELGAWLASLPKPVGVMACYDIRARQVLDACRRVGLGVPDEVAVVGVDNDELLCDLCDPPLSSVQPDARTTGYRAAALLDQLMAGERVRELAHRIPPTGVVTRQSTDMVATTDADVAEALRFIRDNACSGISVKEVLQRVPLSRRVFEARFEALVGRTPHEEIERLRMERVKQLLLGTDLSVGEVARRAGYRHPEYLSVAFRRFEGVSPTAFRARATPAERTP